MAVLGIVIPIGRYGCAYCVLLVPPPLPSLPLPRPALSLPQLTGPHLHSPPARKLPYPRMMPSPNTTDLEKHTHTILKGGHFHTHTKALAIKKKWWVDYVGGGAIAIAGVEAWSFTVKLRTTLPTLPPHAHYP